MLPSGARQLAITIGSYRKTGLYEISSSGDTLARLVELPDWLSRIATGKRKKPFLHMFTSGEIKHPHTIIGESQGHIYVEPAPELGFDGATVGLDTEITDNHLASASLRSIVFYVYATDYRLVERWRISLGDFRTHAKLVESQPSLDSQSSFMPQMMVELKHLKVVA